MKKNLTVLCLSFILFFQSALIQSAPNNLKFQTRTILRRTEVIIVATNKLAKKGGVYTGLGLTVSHQIYARKLFQKGLFRKAIFHSLRARVLVVDLMLLNKKGIMLNEAKFNPAEENYVNESPPAQELDRALKKQILSDNEAAKLLDEMGISLFGASET